jgi:ribosomal protein L17
VMMMNILIWKRDLFWFKKRLQMKLENLINETKQNCKWNNRDVNHRILTRRVIRSNFNQINDDFSDDDDQKFH